ncbi:DNA helicase [Thermococcus chitonophagus]|uniref:DNA helicase n=1 Tax=Thermococcus chitonophagus TaxID=54262 RepID=A0A160VQ91_9EURY|nr:bifunctional RecB family nuclease/DEAD/DEAH box helicase [Thermococcus chitonophagus]ASJ15761.1 DNA helicase [Thermococcus chitonophagus]CUX76985.1 Dna2 helicase involved in Okazaki fragment processing [Thermococcus chitonophagus]
MIELHPSEIARFFELDHCPRFMIFLQKRKKGELREYEGIIRKKETEDRELAKWGEEFELQILGALKGEFEAIYGFFRKGEDTVTKKWFEKHNPGGIIEFESEYDAVKTLLKILGSHENVLVYQAPLTGEIGKFKIKGRADFIAKRGRKYYLLETKFTKEEKLPHRVQAVIYSMLLSKLIDGEINLSVVTRDNAPWPANFLKFPDDVLEFVFTIEDTLSRDFREVEPWITVRCTTCQFEALCLSQALSTGDLGLLGVAPGEKRVLVENGVRDIQDLANLFSFPSNSPVDFREPEVRNRDAVKEIARRTGLNIVRLSRIAQAVLMERGGRVERLYIPGSGYNLPKERGEYYKDLVKVFIYVQKSPITETLIGISALVKGPRGIKGLKEERIISEIVEEAPIEVQTGLEEEAKMLERFFKDLINTIKDLSPSEDIYLHLYFYTRGQRESLVDALRRHYNLWWSKPIRAILSLRRAIDWEGFSILTDELIERHALPFAQGLGIIPVSIQFGYRWRSNRLFEDIFKVLAWKSNGRLFLGKLESVTRHNPLEEPLYPVINRDDAELPFTPFWKALVEMSNSNSEEIALGLHDILGQVVEAMATIEKGIDERYKDGFVKKEPIKRDELENFDMEDGSLAKVLMEYLLLEFHSRRGMLEKYYRLPLDVRAYSEKTAIVKVTKVEKGRECRIWGQLVIPGENGFARYSPDEVLVDIDEDSWVVVTPLDSLGEDDPARIIRRMPLGIVEAIDHKHGGIVIKLISLRRMKFTFPHFGYKCMNGEVVINGVKVRAGNYLVLDPAIDDIGMSRAFEILENIDNHVIYDLLRNLYEDNPEVDVTVDLWDESSVEEFLASIEHLNEEQRAFASDVRHRLVTLQGPPGTGKTSGALAPAILARAYATLKKGRSALFLVTGLSHRAVNEVLLRTYRLIQDMKGKFPLLDRVRLLRGVSGEEAIEVIRKDLGVEVDYVFKEIKFSSGQMSLFGGGKVEILFATPQTAHRLLKNVKGVDLVVVDEASMMDLPMFLLATSKARGQVLLVGDHRQMQPIQVHEWELEDRKTIERHFPFLSALNFVRFLRGELDGRELKRFRRILGRDPPKLNGKKDELLPMYRLKETYRLPQTLARLHTELFYSFDGIELRSAKKPKKEVLDALRRAGKDEFLGFVLDPDYPVVLIVHEEGESTKVNELEASLVERIVNALENVGVGVVVPYRAQKRLIRSRIDVQVDTVERFQGGEKDVIIVSMTSSDPAYLSKVMDFLYDPNRLNVAASRAKEKLIMIASRNIFTLTPRDLDTFELVRPWKRFYVRMREGERFEWKVGDVRVEAYRMK